MKKNETSVVLSKITKEEIAFLNLSECVSVRSSLFLFSDLKKDLKFESL